MDAITECWPLVTAIGEQLREKTQRLNEIAEEIIFIEEAGVYGDIPSESWEARNGGEKRYLRLVFPTRHGHRTRKYVGADPEKIETARAQIERTKRLAELKDEQERITRQAQQARVELRLALHSLQGKSRW